MRTVTLQRIESGDDGTFGRLLDWFSGELPQRGNAPSISCIPAGQYLCRKTYSPRFRRPMILVDGVEHRTGIQVHAANLMGDAALQRRCQLNGCIALGERLGTMDGQKALLLSQPAVRGFEDYVGDDPFMLDVVDAKR